MTTNHIDQLAQWYADAEQVTKTNLPRKGDTLIYPRRTSGYIIESDGGGWAPEFVHSAGETVRILARAPEPKPAWHDAVAVIATFRDERGMVTGVWVPEGQPGYWEGPEGDVVASGLLEDVTPMIEARVTDETLARVEAAFTDDHDSFDARIRAVTAAALGLDPEPAGRSTGPHLHYDAKENA